MLVLSRKKGEEIIATSPSGEVLRLHVVEIRGDKVRLGLDCAREWIIHRREVHDAIKKENDTKKENEE